MRVRLIKPAPSVMQSSPRSKAWHLEPELSSPRSPEPLMGWVAAKDPLSAMKGRLSFSTREEAEAFAHKQGWTLFLEKTNERRVTPKSYLDRFKG